MAWDTARLFLSINHQDFSDTEPPQLDCTSQASRTCADDQHIRGDGMHSLSYSDQLAYGLAACFAHECCDLRRAVEALTASHLCAGTPPQPVEATRWDNRLRRI